MGTITKALNLLNHFSEQREEISLSEFRALTKQDKATIYRHLCALEANGMLEQNPVSKGYRLGPAITRLAAIREATFPLKKLAVPIIDDLSKTLGELAHISVLQGDAMCPIYYADKHNHATHVSLNMSEMLPLHATASGLSMLSFGPSHLMVKIAQQELRACTAKTMTDFTRLGEEIDLIRATGYALIDQGFEIDVVAIAVPIFTTSPEAAGSLTVALPVSRMNDMVKKRIIACLQDSSAMITTSLGGSTPDYLKNIWNRAA